MYHLIMCPFSGDYVILLTADLFETVVTVGIVEVLFSGNYIECEGYRDELYHELSLTVLN